MNINFCSDRSSRGHNLYPSVHLAQSALPWSFRLRITFELSLMLSQSQLFESLEYFIWLILRDLHWPWPGIGLWLVFLLTMLSMSGSGSLSSSFSVSSSSSVLVIQLVPSGIFSSHKNYFLRIHFRIHIMNHIRIKEAQTDTQLIRRSPFLQTKKMDPNVQ